MPADNPAAHLIAAGMVLEEPPSEMDKWLEIYRGNLQAIRKACDARGARLLLLTQPTLYREDLPDELHPMLWRTDPAPAAPSLRYLRHVMNAYNQAMLDFCRDEQVDCIDLAAQLAGDWTALYDDCHFTRSGCEKVSSILAEFFARRLMKPEPVR